LSGVLTAPARYRGLGQQPVAVGHTRRRGGAHPLRRRPERGAVPGAKIRDSVPGVQGLRAPLAVAVRWAEAAETGWDAGGDRDETGGSRCGREANRCPRRDTAQARAAAAELSPGDAIVSEPFAPLGPGIPRRGATRGRQQAERDASPRVRRGGAPNASGISAALGRRPLDVVVTFRSR